MATVLLFKDTQGRSLTCTLTMSAWLKPWICIQRYRTCRAGEAGTSIVTLDAVPFAPTTSMGRVTTPAADAGVANAKMQRHTDTKTQRTDFIVAGILAAPAAFHRSEGSS